MLPLLLDLLRRNWLSLALLAAGAAFGAWAAWSIQGVRLDEARADLAEARQAFTRFKAALALQEEEEAQRADAARRRAADDHRRLSDELEKRIAAGDAYRRCVAAGKCGAVVRDVPAGGCGPTLRLPAAAGPDAAGADPVPAAGGHAADEPGIVADCARATLQLNDLQADIERQPAYRSAP